MSVSYIPLKTKTATWFAHVVERENCEAKVEGSSPTLDEQSGSKSDRGEYAVFSMTSANV